MAPSRISVALMTLNLCAGVSAQQVDLRTAIGAPDIAAVDGRAVAWRNMTLRASAGSLAIEATLPTCADGGRLSNAITPFEHAGARCLSQAGLAAVPPASQEIEAKLKLPRLLRDGPEVHVALRRWGNSREGRGDAGAEMDVELSKWWGPIGVYAGHAAPLGNIQSDERWRATYAGLKIKPARRHQIEWSAESETELRSGVRSTEYSIRYTFAGGATTRARLYVTRTDAGGQTWRSGFGADWNY